MFTKILLATDGSENANRAADAAISLAQGLSLSSITIVNIVTSPPSESRMVQAKFDVHSLLEEESRKIISGTLSRCDAAGIVYTLKVAIGDPAQEILTYVQKEQIDLVVIGSRGFGTIKGVLIGSVSQKIAHLAPCPVLIVK
ncbi:MAG: universal stress protein [Methanomicrobiales archaeon HGW-Methanomicrobiales-5]|nr:MAG: universal stress protein [Methanomicrobiales archaeon HGW-Methanomicrobiales-5]